MELESEVATEVVANESPVEKTQAEPVAPPTVEELAREMRWLPQEEYRGDPAKWKPAHEFVKATVDVNHKLANRLKGVEDQLSHVARTSAQITERAVSDARQKLLDERAEAFDTGDAVKFNRADKELAELPKAAPFVPPETQDFMARNDWFDKDQEATGWAINRTNELANQGLGTARQLAIVEREAKQLFPELYPENKPRARAAPLNQPGARGGQPATKTFGAMPAEAQKAALEYEARGICKRDEYAKTYFEQEA